MIFFPAKGYYFIITGRFSNLHERTASEPLSISIKEVIMTTSALIIINPQVSLFTPAPNRILYNSEKILHNIDLLLEKARSANIPVFFLQQSSDNDPDFSPNSLGWHIHPELTPGQNETVIQKKHWDAFQDTTLQNELQKRNISKLLVVGLLTETSIDSTCRSAHRLGFDVVLVKDAHTTYNTPILAADQIVAHHNRILSDLIDLATTRDLVF